MPNKPFTSHHSKVLKEVTYSSAPATYGNETVFITTSTNRTLLEQTTTSIFKNFSYLKHGNHFKHYTQSNIIPGLKTALADGGISFSFNTLGHYLSNEHPNPFHYLHSSSYLIKNLDQQCGCQLPLSSEQEIALNQLRRNGVELMVIQEKMKQHPLQLKRNSTVSTVELSSETSQTSRSCKVSVSGSINERSTSTLRSVSKNINSPPENKLPNNTSTSIVTGSINERTATLRSVSKNTNSPPENKNRKLELTKSPDLKKQQTSSEADSTKKKSFPARNRITERMESTKKSVKHTLNELSSPKASRMTGKHVAPIYKRGSFDSGVKRSAIRGTIRDIRRLDQLAKPYRYLENALDRYKDLVPPQPKKESHTKVVKAEVSPKALKYIASDRIKELAQPIRR